MAVGGVQVACVFFFLSFFLLYIAGIGIRSTLGWGVGGCWSALFLRDSEAFHGNLLIVRI